MSIKSDIDELLNARVISAETADNIRQYYHNKKELSPNRLVMAFAILGALLIGLGIILIIAHNWDTLNRLSKTVIAFVPLLIGQGLAGYCLVRKVSNKVWKESTATFLVFAIGASISLVSQIYHIPGNFNSFLLTWLLLSIPLVYVLDSSFASLLFILGATVYACNTNYGIFNRDENYMYWLIILLILPHYYILITKRKNSNFSIVQHWFMALSLTICLGTLSWGNEALMYTSYMSMFGIFILSGTSPLLKYDKFINNAYKITGIAGTLIILLLSSFEDAWHHNFLEILYYDKFIFTGCLTLIGILLLYKPIQKKGIWKLPPLKVAFLIYFVIILLNYIPLLSILLINVFILVVAIFEIRKGAAQRHLGKMNIGLLIIASLIACRFFDSEFSFVTRGLLFVFVGICFFVANYWMIKKKKQNEV